MSTQHEQINIEEIHAYVDGQLDEEKSRLLELQMQADEKLRETVEQYQQQNSLLHTLYDSVLDEPLPEKLHVTPTTTVPWRNIAAAVTLLLLGGAVGWTIKDVQTDNARIIANLVKPAAVAHAVFSPEVKHPVEVSAEQQQHLVKWLSKRLGKNVQAPILNDSGFYLKGGRLLPGTEGPAAQFMYEDQSGERLTLYVSSKNVKESSTAFRFYEQNGTHAFYWIDGNLGYVISGNINKERLSDIAHIVYQQLSF